jgi:hypothetical protein
MSDIDVSANSFAYFALLIWPAIALYLFSKLPVGRATLWTILGGYLLLPVGLTIKFEMVPAFNKTSIPNIAALIGCAVFTQRLPKFFRGFGLAEVLFLTFLLGPLITSMLNTDPIQIGPTVLPGVGIYDGGSAAIVTFIYLLPFFLARQFLRSAEDTFELLRALVIAGLAYSLPVLFEVHMSPQLHTWIYGYIPNSITQEFRQGSFRPMVFLGTGLTLSFFTMTTTVAAAALWRTQTRVGRLAPTLVTAYLGFVLVLCKTVGSLVYGAVLVPLVRWAKPHLQLRIASVLVVIALAYPALRLADIFPTNSIIAVASVVSTDRADSLQTRFGWEEKLLEHAWQRPWFGWGRYSRSRVFEAETGTDISITDGYWIITLGQFGIVGFVATFGLLGLSVFRTAMALKYAQTMRERECLAALALIVAIQMIDLLPNSSISPWSWLLSGALLGRAEALLAIAHQRSPVGSMKRPSMGIHNQINRQA